MAAPIRPKDLASGTPTAGADYIFDSGTQVLKTKAIGIVDAAIPLASQAEAEAGTDNVKRVTALRVAQAIDARGFPAAIALKANTADLASNDAGDGLDMIGNGTDIVLGTPDAKEDVPEGNPYADTFTKLSVKLFGDDPTLTGVRGFAFMAGVDNKGQAGTDNVDDLVAGYFGASGTAFTSGDSATVRKPIWAINTVTFLHADSGTYNSRGIETDFVNALRNIGAGDGPAYTSEVVAAGIEIFHSGPFGSTAGVLIGVGSDGSVPFYRGYAVAPGAASQAGFADYSSATYSFDGRGSHTYGLHMTGTYSAGHIINGQVRIGDTAAPGAGLNLDIAGPGGVSVGGFLSVTGSANFFDAIGVKLDGTLKSVSVGANDSGGAGFKVLRVAN